MIVMKQKTPQIGGVQIQGEVVPPDRTARLTNVDRIYGKSDELIVSDVEQPQYC